MTIYINRLCTQFSIDNNDRMVIIWMNADISFGFRCPMMYTGERCQTRMTDLCKERGCVGERAVSCTSDPATQLYDCQCAKGYAGTECFYFIPPWLMSFAIRCYSKSSACTAALT